MRGLEKTLFVIGAVCLAATVSGLGAACGLLALEGKLPSRGGPDMIGGGVVFLFLILGSAGLGAVIGLIVALVRVVRGGSEPWGRRVWRGVTLGLLTGLLLHGTGWLAGLRSQRPTSQSLASVWLHDVAGEWAFRVVDTIPHGPDAAELWGYWPVAVVLTPALGMLGGGLAKLTRRSQKPRVGDPLEKNGSVEEVGS